jgi:hypothetical protein
MATWDVAVPTQVGQSKREVKRMTGVECSVNGGALEVTNPDTGALVTAFGPGFWISATPLGDQPAEPPSALDLVNQMQGRTGGQAGGWARE